MTTKPDLPCEICCLKEACVTFAGDATDSFCAQVAQSVKDKDIERRRMRERLQVLEGWKLDADETELQWIDGHEAYLKYLLDPAHVPTSSHEPGWFEVRRLDGDYDD